MRSLLTFVLLLAAPLVGAPFGGCPGLDGQESTLVASGRVVERVRSASNPGQAYALYIPTGYHGARSWPLLLVMDPEGDAARAIAPFTGAAERYGWIVMSAYGTREAGSGAENVVALNALLADAGASFQIDPKRIHLAGFGGTVRLAWDVAARLGEAVAGIYGVGALPGTLVPLLRLDVPPDLVFFGAAGEGDYGYEDVRALEPWLESRDIRYRLRFFDGGHEWAPEEVAEQALAWFELQAMRSGRKVQRPEWIDSLLAVDLAAAAALDEAARPVEALGRYREILGDYRGAAETGRAREAAERLAADPDVEARLGARRRQALRFQEFMGRVSGWVIELRDAREPPSPEGGIWILDLEGLRTRAAQGSPDQATAADRQLTAARVRLVFEAEGFLKAGDPERALVVLDVAAATGEADVEGLLVRAAAELAMDRKEPALEALVRAVRAGGSPDAIRADPRFEALRSHPRFRSLGPAPAADDGPGSSPGKSPNQSTV